MPDALLAGLPLPAARRLASQMAVAGAAWPAHWRVTVSPLGAGARTGLTVAQAVRLTGEATALRTGDACAHVYAFPQGAPESPHNHAVAAALRPYVRFAWLDAHWLAWIQNDVPTFVARVNEFLEAEDAWVSDVRPSRVSDALVLPEPSFEADPAVCRLWQQAQAAGHLDDIRGAKKLAERFTVCHRHTVSRRAVWIDAAQRVFDAGGARHGDAEPPRTHKLSYFVGDFHFDVKSTAERVFAVTDCDGVRHPVQKGAHLNVDAHGNWTHGR